jgi:hypothetical protein
MERTNSDWFWVSCRSTFPIACPSYGSLVRENVVRPQGSEGAGRRLRMATAARLKRDGSIRLFANGARRSDRAAAVARRRGERAEVARSHRLGRNECDDIGRRLRGARAMIRAEKEYPVPHDRSADRPAELITHQEVVGLLARRRVDRCEIAGALNR